VKKEEVLNVRLRKLAKLRKEKSDLEKELKGITIEIETLSPEIVETMEAMGVTNLKLKNVGMFYLETQGYPIVKDSEILQNSLRKRGLGDIIKETVNYQTLRATCKELLENNEALPDGVEVFMKTTVRVRR